MPTHPSYSVKEAAVLAGLSERVIRNEIERGVIRLPRRAARGARAAVALPKGAVLYFRLLRDMPVRLPRSDRSDLYRLLSHEVETAGGWRLDSGRLRHGILVLDAKTVRSDLDRELRAYEAGRRRAVSHPDTLSGEPVFAGTRIAIRHIGKLARRGVATDDIRADYPALSEADIRFAALFVQMKPDPGRPAKLKFRRAAA